MPKKNDFDDGRWEANGRNVALFEYICFGGWQGDIEVQGFSVRIPAEKHLETLVVVRGLAADGTPMVCFHSAVGVAEAIAGAALRVADGTVRWKVDGYRAPPGIGSGKSES